MITDPTAMNLFSVNLEGARLIQIDDEALDPEVHVELEREVVGCPTCEVVASVKGRRLVLVVDLTMVGRKIVSVWNKRRFAYRESKCPTGTWTEDDERIAAPRLKMTDRAGRWATFEVGKNGRTVAEIAEHLGCDWPTVNDAVRELYTVPDYELAGQLIDELIRDMADESWPIEVRSLSRTLKRWRNEIIAWHQLHITNGPTEAMNNLAKRVKRVAFGFRSLRNYPIRTLLYAGKPNWDLLATVTPRRKPLFLVTGQARPCRPGLGGLAVPPAAR